SKSEVYTQSLLTLLESIVLKFKEYYTFEIAYQVASDRSFCELLYAHLKIYQVVSLQDKQIDLIGANYYHTADFVLTNRLHVALLAYKFDCMPVVVTDIEQHAKISGIFRDAQLPELLIDTNQNIEKSISHIALVLREKLVIMSKFNTIEASCQKVSTEIMEQIFSN